MDDMEIRDEFFEGQDCRPDHQATPMVADDKLPDYIKAAVLKAQKEPPKPEE